MILKRILIVLAVVVITCIISTGLLLIGNMPIDIYTKVNTNIKDFENKNIEKEVVAILETNENMIENNVSEIEQAKNINSYYQNVSNSVSNEERMINNNVSQSKENLVENKDTQEEYKKDEYTFVKNDREIQNMISITKRLIIENKENRYSGLVDNVNNINFVIEKSGNVFYPLYEYRIANIVMDNNYPEFYVYAEDVYKNGEYLITEYYFQ